MSVTCCRPHARPLTSGREGGNQALSAHEPKVEKRRAFTGRRRGQPPAPGLSLSALRVGGCRLRFVAQHRPRGGRRASPRPPCPVLGPRRERKTCRRGGQRALRLHIPPLPPPRLPASQPALPPAATKISNPAAQNSAVATSSGQWCVAENVVVVVVVSQARSTYICSGVEGWADGGGGLASPTSPFSLNEGAEPDPSVWPSLPCLMQNKRT